MVALFAGASLATNLIVAGIAFTGGGFNFLVWANLACIPVNIAILVSEAWRGR